MSTCAMLLRKDVENIRRIVKKEKEEEKEKQEAFSGPLMAALDPLASLYVGLVQDAPGFCRRRDMRTSRTWFYGERTASGAAKELEVRP